MTEDWTSRPFIDVPAGATPAPGTESIDAEFLNSFQTSLRAKMNQSEGDARYLQLTGGILTGLVTAGSGDALQAYGTTVRSGQRLDIRKGTTASPDTSAGPLLKVHRKIGHTQANMQTLTGNVGSDGSGELAAIEGIAENLNVTDQVQPIGVRGVSISHGSAGSLSGSGAYPDAAGVFGLGWTKAGDGSAIGACFYGRREVSTAGISALEVASVNYSTEVLAGTGWDEAHAVFIAAQGTADSGSGILFTDAVGRKFDAGILFGSNNPIKSRTFADYGNAERSLFVKGTHTVGALVVGNGSGPVIIGADTPLYTSGTTRAFPNAILEVNHTAAQDPAIVFGGQAGNTWASIWRNGSGSFSIGVSGGANNGITGTASGEGFLRVNTSAKVFHMGGTTRVVSISQDNKYALFGGTPVVQPTGWGTPTGTLTRTTFDTATVTLSQLAERVAAMITDDKGLGHKGA